MDHKPSNIPAEPDIMTLESNKMESMEEAISTREDFLKFVNELPISIESSEAQNKRSIYSKISLRTFHNRV